jgi:hypothetical protein
MFVLSGEANFTIHTPITRKDCQPTTIHRVQNPSARLLQTTYHSTEENNTYYLP